MIRLIPSPIIRASTSALFSCFIAYPPRSTPSLRPGDTSPKSSLCGPSSSSGTSFIKNIVTANSRCTAVGPSSFASCASSANETLRAAGLDEGGSLPPPRGVSTNLNLSSLSPWSRSNQRRDGGKDGGSAAASIMLWRTLAMADRRLPVRSRGTAGEGEGESRAEEEGSGRDA
jgi:hypothetical protein